MIDEYIYIYVVVKGGGREGKMRWDYGISYKYRQRPR